MIYAIVALSLYLPKIPFLPIISADFTHEGSHPPAPPNPPDPPPHSEEFCPCSRGHRRGSRCSETSSSIFPRPSTRQEWHSSPSSSTRHRGFGASPQSATDAMSLLAWNCQGVGGSLDSAKMRHLARLISSTDAQVIFISETRNSRFNKKDLMNRFNLENAYIVSAEGLSGGL